MFNLKKMAIAAAANMVVRDAAGDVQLDDAGKELSITLCSPGTKQHQKAKHARDERHNARVLARMQGKGDSKMSAEDHNVERAEFLAACTLSFNGHGIEGMAGYEMYKAAYADIEIGHVADDVEKFLGERGNFKKGSAKPSEPTSATLPG